MLSTKWYIIIGALFITCVITDTARANSVEKVEGCVFVSGVAQDALELKRGGIARGEAIEQLREAYRSSPSTIVSHLVDGVYDNIGTAVQPRTLGDKVFSHCLTLEVVKEYSI